MGTVDPLITALRARRVAIGMSQRDLAEAVRVERLTVAKREQGVHAPDLVALRRWADALHCDIVLKPRRDFTVTDDMAGVATIRPAGQPGRRPEAQCQAIAVLVDRHTRAGRSGQEIADALGLSRRTVVRYRNRLRSTEAA